jgi:hypothetical protein
LTTTTTKRSSIWYTILGVPRGVLCHSPRIDPGVRYPPYSEHRRERALESKLP